MSANDALWVGGVGWPYDDLLAASLRAHGQPAEPLGELDEEAMARGVAALPRGQCAPALFTTGALLRRAEAASATTNGGQRPAYLRLNTCGPCRFALFGLGYERALRVAGHAVRLPALEQSLEGLASRFGADTALGVMDALLVGDALAETLRRERRVTANVEALERRASDALVTLGRAVEAREDMVEALLELGPWADGARRPPMPHAPVVAVVGEPFSLHVDGPAQLNLSRVLARTGARALMPPLALWVAYQLWTQREPAFGHAAPADSALVTSVQAREAVLRTRYAQLMHAASLDDYPLPDVDHLAELASPHLPRGWRAGYGHVEVGLALEAALERGAHLIISVKSFGCLPSSAVADAILPAALRGHAPFLALEVSGDGEAARESRLSLRLSAARQAAAREASTRATDMPT